MALVEKPDKTYEWMEMGEPECGEDFCDGCGDCLDCQYHGPAEWDNGQSSHWVIYLDNPKNPFHPEYKKTLTDPK